MDNTNQVPLLADDDCIYYAELFRICACPGEGPEEGEPEQTNCNDCGAPLCAWCGECHNGCFLAADDCSEEGTL